MSKEDVIEVQTLLALEEEHEYTSALDALVDFMIVRDAIDTDNEITIGIKLETSLIGH